MCIRVAPPLRAAEKDASHTGQKVRFALYNPPPLPFLPSVIWSFRIVRRVAREEENRTIPYAVRDLRNRLTLALMDRGARCIKWEVLVRR